MPQMTDSSSIYSCREQIQEDLRTFLEARISDNDPYKDEVIDHCCAIVCVNFAEYGLTQRRSVPN